MLLFNSHYILGVIYENVRSMGILLFQDIMYGWMKNGMECTFQGASLRVVSFKLAMWQPDRKKVPISAPSTSLVAFQLIESPSVINFKVELDNRFSLFPLFSH